MVIVEHCLRDFYQPFAQNVMCDVGVSLFTSADAVEFGYFGVSETFHLWKHIPHPVSTFVTVLNFFKSLGVSAGSIVDSSIILGMDEAEQIALLRLVF